MTLLKGAIQMLARGRETSSPAMHNQLTEQALRSLNKLNDLISSLLNTNWLSQGRFPVHKTNFVMAEVADASSKHIRMAGKHEIKLSGELGLQCMRITS